MSVSVRPLMHSESAAWDEFVASAQNATFFHLHKWSELLEGAFGHKAHYLAAKVDDKIVGVLPLVEMRSRIFGNSLSSTPFCVSGGIVANDAAARDALAAAAQALAVDLGVDALELRGGDEPGGEWLEKSLYVEFKREIAEDAEANLLAIPRKQRAVVRKALKRELLSVETDDVDRFFQIYSESVRNLGTPVFARRYFHQLKDAFGDACRMLMIVQDGTDIAAVMSFYFRDQVLPYYGGGIAAARGVGANDFMYWELMRRSGEDGIRVFDYGRSKVDTGAYKFKKNWGFVPQPVTYRYHLVLGESMPEVNPNNPKYRLAIEGWKRLPLPVANAVGPFLSRTLG